MSVRVSVLRARSDLCVSFTLVSSNLPAADCFLPEMLTKKMQSQEKNKKTKKLSKHQFYAQMTFQMSSSVFTVDLFFTNLNEVKLSVASQQCECNSALGQKTKQRRRQKQLHGGRANAGAPSEGSPSEGSPSEGSPTEGSPSEGPPSEGSPSEGSPSEGSPSEGSPSEGSPSEGSPSEVSPSEGSPSEVSPSEGSPHRITPMTRSPLPR